MKVIQQLLPFISMIILYVVTYYKSIKIGNNYNSFLRLRTFITIFNFYVNIKKYITQIHIILKLIFLYLRLIFNLYLDFNLT